MQFAGRKSLTHKAEHDRGVHRGAGGPGRDFGWRESHLRRRQSNSATTEGHGFSAAGLEARFKSSRLSYKNRPFLSKSDCIGKKL